MYKGVKASFFRAIYYTVRDFYLDVRYAYKLWVWQKDGKCKGDFPDKPFSWGKE